MAKDPASLLAQANCYECYGTSSTGLDLLELGLLNNWANQGSPSGNHILTEAGDFLNTEGGDRLITET